jgi:hypothetical protein
MHPHDFPTFNESLTVIAEAFDMKLSPQRINLYFEALADFDWSQVERALGRAIKTCKFFPKVAEILELIEGSPDDRAQIAWVGAWAAVTTQGRYRSIRCEDAVVAETIRRVFRTWPDFCNLPAEGVEHNVKHREFLETYRVLAKRQEERYGDYLVGVFESENTRLGSVMDHGALSDQHPVGLIAANGSVTTVHEPLPAELKPLTAGTDETIALESILSDAERQGPLALPEGRVDETPEERESHYQRLRSLIVRDVRADRSSVTDAKMQALRDIAWRSDEDEQEASR